ncbi:hypothetical protein M407DRAFT_25920 [Tulasnella calospora MUT 4182]|uniref:Uncharacterized protein n=1 Tax=Tulasnella calospora MUT 4182 TaxID=1051891 RepID=A0A0C3LTG3_9AGAM|nr:hypothetical protein M407DRAFT_25920 [Tulasnella calospora MUT 4182]
MASKSSGIMIVPSQTTPKDASLHLMPFNIAYTGPAPLSLYWNVRDEPEEEEKDEAKPNPAPSASPSDTQVAEADSQESSASTLVDAPVANSLKDKAKSLQKRFIAAFRGRRLHGLEVGLPPGYSGVVLVGAKEADEPSDDTKTGTKRKRGAAKDDGGAAKKLKQVAKTVVSGVTGDEGEAPPPAKQFTPAGTFSSFVAWAPDRKFDEKDDQYVRSLDEWVRLSALIHSAT